MIWLDSDGNKRVDTLYSTTQLVVKGPYIITDSANIVAFKVVGVGSSPTSIFVFPEPTINDNSCAFVSHTLVVDDFNF